MLILRVGCRVKAFLLKRVRGGLRVYTSVCKRKAFLVRLRRLRGFLMQALGLVS